MRTKIPRAINAPRPKVAYTRGAVSEAGLDGKGVGCAKNIVGIAGIGVGDAGIGVDWMISSAVGVGSGESLRILRPVTMTS